MSYRDEWRRKAMAQNDAPEPARTPSPHAQAVAEVFTGIYAMTERAAATYGLPDTTEGKES